jgi:hypothetical protein
LPLVSSKACGSAIERRDLKQPHRLINRRRRASTKHAIRHELKALQRIVGLPRSTAPIDRWAIQAIRKLNGNREPRQGRAEARSAEGGSYSTHTSKKCWPLDPTPAEYYRSRRRRTFGAGFWLDRLPNTLRLDARTRRLALIHVSFPTTITSCFR